jgi:ammonium transporter, Amt family
MLTFATSAGAVRPKKDPWTVRFKTNIRDKECRRYFWVFFAGKMLGLATVAAIIYVFMKFVGAHAFASTTDPTEITGKVTKNETVQINAINTTWTLVTAFLVFFMQAGFMFLEAGFARSREAVNVLLECIVDTCLCALLFWAFGFAFMFGVGNGWIGHTWFFLNNPPTTYTPFGTGVAFYAFVLFQYAFADTCSTVTSGAMVGRTGFVGDLIYSIGVSGFIYPILGHWVWGPGGWLSTWTHPLPFHDFAGSTVVHSIGGFISLAGAMVLGPRLGRKFKRDGGGLLPPHDLTVAAVGGVILWFGWYGFNPGSTLSAIDYTGIGRIALNTTLAASAAGLSAMFILYPMVKKWDLGISINGFLAGLVAITCPCYWVNPLGAVIIGLVAGGVVIIGVELLEYLRIDDPIGAWPVHGLCGIWGTLSLGLFATGQWGASSAMGPVTTPAIRGLFYGGGGSQLLAQLIGSAVICAATFAIAFIMFKVIDAFGILRISREGELEGIDLHEHGTVAYHTEFGYGMSTTSPPSEDGASGGVHAPSKAGSST